MKNLITSTILLLALLLPAVATAADIEVDGIYYNINRINATLLDRHQHPQLRYLHRLRGVLSLQEFDRNQHPQLRHYY